MTEQPASVSARTVLSYQTLLQILDKLPEHESKYVLMFLTANEKKYKNLLLEARKERTEAKAQVEEYREKIRELNDKIHALANTRPAIKIKEAVVVDTSVRPVTKTDRANRIARQYELIGLLRNVLGVSIDKSIERAPVDPAYLIKLLETVEQDIVTDPIASLVVKD
jgi:vacuolar-type H+-ATPase subunit I/STV1